MQAYGALPPPPPPASASSSSATTQTPLIQAFPPAAALSRDDLQDLLSDERYQAAFVHTLPQVEALQNELAAIERENEALAECNLALKPELEQLRSETMAAFTEAHDLKARWREIERQQAAAYQRYSPGFLSLRLRHAMGQQDDESEALASAYIEGSRADTPSFLPSADGSSVLQDKSIQARQLEDFVKDFKQARKVFHKRAIWSERWGRGEVAWQED